MGIRLRSWALILAGLLQAGQAFGQQQGPAYPEARRIDHSDVYHGTEIASSFPGIGMLTSSGSLFVSQIAMLVMPNRSASLTAIVSR